MAEQVPLGYVFNPTDEQLLYYLRTKVGGLQTLVSPPKLEDIQEKDLYGDRAPSEIFPISASSDHDFFCYTLIKNKSGNGTGVRKDRIVSGKGTWKGTQGPKKIHHPQHKSMVIGYRRVLNFIPAAAASASNKKYNRSSWIMHEYGLDSYPSSDNHAQFWVLCRINYTAGKKTADVVEESSKKRCTTQVQLYDDQDQPPPISTHQHTLPLQSCLSNSFTSATSPADCSNQPFPTATGPHHVVEDVNMRANKRCRTEDQAQPLHLPPMSMDHDSLPLQSCLSNSLTAASSPADCSNQPTPTSHYCFDPQSSTDDTQHSMLQSDDQALPPSPTMLNATTTTLDQAQGSMQHFPEDLGFLDGPMLSEQEWDDMEFVTCHESDSEPQDDQFPLPTWIILRPTSDQGFHSPPLPSSKDSFDTIHEHQPSSSHSKPQSYSDMLSEINSCLMDDDDDSGLDDFCKLLELPDDIASVMGLVLD